MKILLVVLGVLIAYQVNANFNDSVLVFKKGDQFLQTTNTNSNYLWKKGNNSVAIETRLAVTKLYIVNEITDEGYLFTVVIKKIIDTVSTRGRKRYYNSEDLGSTESVIEKAIQGMIGELSVIMVNKKGTIVSVQQPVKKNSYDTALVTFSGLEQCNYIPGTDAGLFLKVPLSFTHKSGYNSLVSAFDSSFKANTTYKIASQSDSFATIQFTSKVSEKHSNTNVNGVLVTDNTGMILTRLTQSITIAYKKINGVVYTMDKRSAVNENYKKL